MTATHDDMIENYDPNSVGLIDAGIFGLPHSAEQAAITLIPVPWDVTTSYRPGTHAGPAAILEASPQLDLYHPDFPNLWKRGIAMLEEQGWIAQDNDHLRADAEQVIEALESGEPLTAEHEALISTINAASAKVTGWLKDECLKWIEKGKLVGVVGGDHSVPLGSMQAQATVHDSFGLLHFDAHHDYRDAYMGFEQSHASIMFNAAKIPQITKLVQLGIRDYCEQEAAFAASQPNRLITYYDQQLKKAEFQGKTWHDQCVEIISLLPEKVYISFDIDALSPHLCPNTGTPVPGGFSFEQAVYLIQLLASQRHIIGFDMVEVAGDAESIDPNVGARLLWNLCGYASISQSAGK